MGDFNIQDQTGSKTPPKMTGNVWQDIAEFQKHFGFDKSPVSFKFLFSQLQFLREELDETMEALLELDAEGFFDGLVDLAVVDVGTLAFIGEENNEGRDGWVDVMDKNCQKVVGFNPQRQNSGGIDLVKPEGWTPPDHSARVRWLKLMFAEVSPEELAEVRQLAGYELSERESVRVLRECIKILNSKSGDYDAGGVSPADYYPQGVDNFWYLTEVLKRNRQKAQIEALRENPNHEPNNEGLEDTIKDRINYLALEIEWLRGRMPGQPPTGPFNTDWEGVEGGPRSL